MFEIIYQNIYEYLYDKSREVVYNFKIRGNYTYFYIFLQIKIKESAACICIQPFWAMSNRLQNM